MIIEHLLNFAVFLNLVQRISAEFLIEFPRASRPLDPSNYFLSAGKDAAYILTPTKNGIATATALSPKKQGPLTVYYVWTRVLKNIWKVLEC